MDKQLSQAYIILAHKDMSQLEMLINRVLVEENIVVVHIDKKVSNREFKAIESKYDTNENIVFIKDRINCVWGDYTIVKATNKCIEKLISLNKQFSHAILLSGMDYPIKSNQYIREFLNNNLDTDFIECQKDNKYVDDERYTKYYFKWSHLFKNKHIAHNIFRLQYKLSYTLNIKRNHPKFNEIYFGSQWWILSKNTLNDLYSFIKENKAYLKFYKNTNIPDEFFYQTIIGNIKKENRENYNMHFMIWKKDAWHPETMLMENKEDLLKSDKLFARKFDINSSKDLLQYINKNI